jgi:hypothetical protein
VLKEYDVVHAKKNLTKTVFQGCRGTILMIFNSPSLAYEVEFVDEEGRTLELLTVKQSDIVLDN